MVKAVLGVVAGLLAFVVVVTVASPLLRAWPAYAAVAGTMAFTLPMKIARLTIGALATLAAGFVTVRISRSTAAMWTTGGLLLAAFIPQHISLWDKFPLWYHLTFLASLVPLTWVGGRLASDRAAG